MVPVYESTSSKVGGSQCGAANIEGKPKLTSPILLFLDLFSCPPNLCRSTRDRSDPTPRIAWPIPPARPPNRSEKSGIPQRKNPWQNKADRYFRSRPPLKNQHPKATPLEYLKPHHFFGYIARIRHPFGIRQSF
jgi:hypothetical protein